MNSRREQREGFDRAMPSDSKGRKRGRGATTARMRDVAHRAGVSVMTVSRTLNDPDKVSEEMRRRVGAAVGELGYVHNRLARSPSSNRSNVIWLIVPSLRNSLFAQTIKGISDVLSDNESQLMIADRGPALARKADALPASPSQPCPER